MSCPPASPVPARARAPSPTRVSVCVPALLERFESICECLYFAPALVPKKFNELCRAENIDPVAFVRNVLLHLEPLFACRLVSLGLGSAVAAAPEFNSTHRAALVRYEVALESLANSTGCRDDIDRYCHFRDARAAIKC